MDNNLSESLAHITRLLGDVHGKNRRMPSTVLYNEGWLLRLVVDWYARHPEVKGLLSFHEGSNWYSEALLTSPFLRGRFREGYTRADAVIGHFDLVTDRGDISLAPNASQFVVIEAKMGSRLSLGTRHSPDYNQAARNVACMVKLIEPLAATPVDARFIVMAPAAKLAEHGMEAFLDDPHISDVVRRRADQRGEVDRQWVESHFVPRVEGQKLLRLAVSWEVVLGEISDFSPVDGGHLQTFYQQCLRHIRRKAIES